MKKHALDVKKQMAEKSEQREQDKKVVAVENKQLKDVYQGQKDLIEKIKKDKINDLKGLSIPEKYIVELENKKIN